MATVKRRKQHTDEYDTTLYGNGSLQALIENVEDNLDKIKEIKWSASNA